MSETEKTVTPIGGELPSAGFIASIHRAKLGLGEMLQAIQTFAAGSVAEFERVQKAAREAKAEAESAVALQGAASTNQAGATSGSPSTPDGGRGAQARGVQRDPLAQMRDQILQSLGRK